MTNRHISIAVSAMVALTLAGCATGTTTPTGHAETNQAVITKPAKSDLNNTHKTPEVFGERKFPYPYKAMLALSSDADHMTLRKFNLIHEFLNTKEKTPFGYYGLGLDVSDSFFMYNGQNLPQIVDYGHKPMKDELTYFKGISSTPYGKSVIDHYIQSGWLDTLHSYGDFSQVNPHHTLFSRALANQAVSALKAAGDNVTVWTDHGNMSNVDNFGSYGVSKFYTYQQGANPHSPYYHTNLTIPYGVHFVWADRSSDVFSRRTTLYPIQLQDGRHVWGFWRYTDSGITRHQTEWNWSIGGLSAQLSQTHLNQLIAQHGYAIVAQHFYALNTKLPLPGNAIDALWRLADEYNHGNILVARESRLLNYNVLQQYVTYDVTYAKGVAYIHVRSIRDPVFGTYVPTVADLHGITFYTTNPAQTVLEIGNTRIPQSDLQDNPSDGLYPSIGVKWFAPDTKNYAVTAPGVF